MNPNGSPVTSLVRTTLLAFLVVGISSWGGFALCNYVPIAFSAAVLKYGTAVIAIIWVFSLTVYNKLSDITDISGLDYDQHRRIEVEVRGRLQWFWFRAFVLGILALGMYLPSLLVETKIPLSPYLIAIGCGSFALSLFSLRRIWRELEDIRQLRSYVKEIERREKERADQVKELKEGNKAEWKPDDALDGFRRSPQSDQNDDPIK